MDGDTANLLTTVINGLNDYLMAVAEKQIYLAFEHAQKERELLSQRTSEGLKQAKLMGSRVGRQPGQKVITKKHKNAIRYIKSNYELFGGCLTATECMRITQITKSTFYRYIDEIKKDLNITIKETTSHVDEASLESIREKVKQHHMKLKLS